MNVQDMEEWQITWKVLLIIYYVLFDYSLFIAINCIVILQASYQIMLIIAYYVYRVDFYSELMVPGLFLVLGLATNNFCIIINEWN